MLASMQLTQDDDLEFLRNAHSNRDPNVNDNFDHNFTYILLTSKRDSFTQGSELYMISDQFEYSLLLRHIFVIYDIMKIGCQVHESLYLLHQYLNENHDLLWKDYPSG